MVSDTEQVFYASVNHPGLDETHRQLAEYADHLKHVDDQEFPARFLLLLGQVEVHFAEEEELMHYCGFRHAAEHKEEHQQLLQELRQLIQRRLPFARAYISERLPERFNLHITRMDSLLASALNQH